MRRCAPRLRDVRHRSAAACRATTGSISFSRTGSSRRFRAIAITVVYDYPASQCALAKIRDGDPPVAERFELYLGVHELANGYHELTDAVEQRARFERDNGGGSGAR